MPATAPALAPAMAAAAIPFLGLTTLCWVFLAPTAAGLPLMTRPPALCFPPAAERSEEDDDTQGEKNDSVSGKGHTKW